jgi:hypothetical protein
MRDDFSQKTKDILARRVRFVCSNPECRRSTSGPGEEPDKAVNIGVAAHITAASEGGPRYDPFMSANDRSSIENGIWLCQNCAHLIDADPEKYSTETLYRWKNQAETEARASIGRRSGMSSEEMLLLSEAEALCAESIEYLRYIVENEETHLLRDVVLLPNKQIFFGAWGGTHNSIYYEDQPVLIQQFRWLHEQGFLEKLNDRTDTPLYRIKNSFYRWLQIS